MLVWFKDYANQIKPQDFQFDTLKREFAQLRASGRTSMTAGLEVGREGGFEPQNIIVITDGQENLHQGRWLTYATRHQMAKVVSEMEVVPQIVIIGLGNYEQSFTRSFENKGISTDEFIFSNSDEYYVYDQVGALLAGARRKTLTETIARMDLPYIVEFV